MNLFKYPRTFHLPWSEGLGSDDKRLNSIDEFVNKTVVITEKMDGENTTLYRDHIHARSLDWKSHESRDWITTFWGQIRNDIPNGWRVCGENLFAKHSIHYDELESYFIGFSIWNEKNECLSWEESKTWFKLLGILPASVIYEGIFNENYTRKIWNEIKNEKIEGYVLRNSDKFDYTDFNKNVAKFVRQNHVTDTKHWMFNNTEITKNKLK